jgi:hypothetical protein
MFGFIIVTVFSTLIYGYYDRVSESNIKISLKQIAIQTAHAITKLYYLGKESGVVPDNSTSIIIKDMDLNYPDKVSGKNFEVELISSPGIWNIVTDLTIDNENITIRKETTSSSKIIAKTTQRPFLTYEHDFPNLPVILQGKFRSGENDTLRFFRYNYNGVVNDTIILGEPNIIIGITSIS